ncbi:MAG: quinol:electron acceptor oxidoreductase subunit ActD [Candidatus Binatia bacterium]
MAGKAVFGLFSSAQQAARAANELKAAGFTPNDISVLLPDQNATRDFAHEANTKMPEGVAAGAGTGGLIGAGLGWLVGIGSLAIPGLGPFIAAGPIMAALSGAAVGAAVGGLTGALVGMGIPEIEAKQYESKLREGNVLLSVHTEDGAQRELATEILERYGAHDISSSGEASVPRRQAAAR